MENFHLWIDSPPNIFKLVFELKCRIGFKSRCFKTILEQIQQIRHIFKVDGEIIFLFNTPICPLYRRNQRGFSRTILPRWCFAWRSIPRLFTQWLVFLHIWCSPCEFCHILLVFIYTGGLIWWSRLRSNGFSFYFAPVFLSGLLQNSVAIFFFCELVFLK